MANEKPEGGDLRRSFHEFLASCPSTEESPQTIQAVGAVLRTGKKDAFSLRPAEGAAVEIPVEAVTAFAVLAGGPGARMAQVTLDVARLPPEIAERLGGLKQPGLDTLKEVGGADTVKEQVFDTLKETSGGDTLKEQPLDTLKETGGGDTFKEQPFDTLKEIGGGDTLKEQPLDTLKEVGGGDTFKEQPFDTLKEAGGGDTIKELAKDPLGDGGGGGGTGIADSLVENIPGVPGGGVIQPRADLAAAQAFAGPAAAPPVAPASLGTQAAFDVGIPHTIKELVADPTFKEILQDFTIKEVILDTVKELAKDPIFDPPIPVPGGFPGPGPGPLAGLAQGVAAPFVLATPHQAPQGALAQQYLAAQMMRGGGGLF